MGRQFSAEDLEKAGERIWNLTRLYNLRAGFTGEDDSLPPRFLTQPLAEGGSAGRVVRLDEMLAEYYRFRGWNQEGIPTAKKLAALGLEELAKEFSHA